MPRSGGYSPNLVTSVLPAIRVVIFAADHGDSLGMHAGMIDKAHSMFEETTHIPFIVRAPFMESGKQGSREEVLISLVDFAPTCLDLAGLSVPPTMQGMSLLPLLTAGGSRESWRESLVSECHGLAGALFSQRMVQRGSEKYVYNCGDVDEFYNLADDPISGCQIFSALDLLKQLWYL